jgi:hypothetical protein
MKSTTLNELKKELQLLPNHELVELCVNVAKYKKDNKEYMGYLLFQSHDKEAFVKEVKEEIDFDFNNLKTQNNLYLIKKSLRKTLRTIGKYCKYLNDKALSAELYIYFCYNLKKSGVPIQKSQLLINLYQQQLKKINSFISVLHEDLRGDYSKDLEKIEM